MKFSRADVATNNQSCSNLPKGNSAAHNMRRALEPHCELYAEAAFASLAHTCTHAYLETAWTAAAIR